MTQFTEGFARAYANILTTDWEHQYSLPCKDTTAWHQARALLVAYIEILRPMVEQNSISEEYLFTLCLAYVEYELIPWCREPGRLAWMASFTVEVFQEAIKEIRQHRAWMEIA